MANAAEESAVNKLIQDAAVGGLDEVEKLWATLGEIEGRVGTELAVQKTVAIIAHGNDNTTPYQTVVLYEGYPPMILSEGPVGTSELPDYAQKDKVPDGIVTRISLVADEATIGNMPVQNLDERNCVVRCFLLLIGLHQPDDFESTVAYFEGVAIGHEALQYVLYGTMSHREYSEGANVRRKRHGSVSLETLQYFCVLMTRLRLTRMKFPANAPPIEWVEDVAPKTEQETTQRYRRKTSPAVPPLMEHSVAIFFDLGFMVDPLKNVCVQLAGMSRQLGKQPAPSPAGIQLFRRLVSGKCGRFLVTGPVAYPYGDNFIAACDMKPKYYKVEVTRDDGSVHNWCACANCAPKLEELRMYIGVRDIPLRMDRPLGTVESTRKRKHDNKGARQRAAAPKKNRWFSLPPPPPCCMWCSLIHTQKHTIIRGQYLPADVLLPQGYMKLSLRGVKKISALKLLTNTYTSQPLSTLIPIYRFLSLPPLYRQLI
jgi:hypothetical protein